MRRRGERNKNIINEKKKRKKKSSFAELTMVQQSFLLWHIRKTLFGSDNFFVLGSTAQYTSNVLTLTLTHHSNKTRTDQEIQEILSQKCERTVKITNVYIEKEKFFLCHRI